MSVPPFKVKQRDTPEYKAGYAHGLGAGRKEGAAEARAEIVAFLRTTSGDVHGSDDAKRALLWCAERIELLRETGPTGSGDRDDKESK